MQRTLVAALCSLLVSTPVLADESPRASAPARAAPAEPASSLAAGSDATPSTATAPTEAAATRESRREPAVNPANKTDVTPVKQIQLSTLDDHTVCRKEEQTGSRIAVKRCYSTAETAVSRAQRDIVRRDIEEMRDRQIYEQLRRASVATMPMGPAPR